jgi:hypothetical protein
MYSNYLPSPIIHVCMITILYLEQLLYRTRFPCEYSHDGRRLYISDSHPFTGFAHLLCIPPFVAAQISDCGARGKVTQKQGKLLNWLIFFYLFFVDYQYLQ